MTCRLCSSSLSPDALFCTECGAAVAPAPQAVSSAHKAGATTPARSAVPVDVITPDAGWPTLPPGQPPAAQTPRDIASVDPDVYADSVFHPVAIERLISRLLGTGVALLLPIGAIALTSGQDPAAVIMVAALGLLMLSLLWSK